MLPDVEHDRNHFSKGFFVHVIVMPGVATLGQNSKIIFCFNNSKKLQIYFFKFPIFEIFIINVNMVHFIENVVSTSLFSKKNVQIIYILEGPEFCNIYNFFLPF